MTEESLKVAEARRKAEQARARFWGTFDEIIDYAHRLQDRLAPSHLARDAWDDPAVVAFTCERYRATALLIAELVTWSWHRSAELPLPSWRTGAR